MRDVWNSYTRWMLDDKGYALSTRRGYMQGAQQVHRWLRSNGHDGLPWATKETLKLYWDASQPSVATRARIRTALCAFFRFTNDLGWRPDNPAESLPKLKRPKGMPRPLMGSDAQKILDVAAAMGPMTNAIVHLLAYTGIRNAELRGLKWSDLQGDMLRVNGKGNKVRIVPVPEIAMAPLQVWRRESASPDWMFHATKRDDRQLSQSSLKHLTDEVSDAACVPFTPHVLRHTFATELVDVTNGNIAVVQQAMGHASASTTAIYGMVKPRNLQEGMSKLNYHAAR